MPRSVTQMEKLREEEACYQKAKVSGNRQEQARWANAIGNLLKDRGQYLQALNWFKIDSDICVKYLSTKHRFPAFQSVGEIYLRLQHYEDAITYQKKHLLLAYDAGDLVEQQRANTQLGRTYHDMYLNCLDQHQSLKNAKKYFNSAMKLAQIIKENTPINTSSFIKEYIDAHNNIGLLQLDCDNVEEANKIFTKALAICKQEKMYDDALSRLYHNLGKIYTELRMWVDARQYIEKDIQICNQNGHCEGEAKGYINLGELHNRVQRYIDATLRYQKALSLAKLMEDEALVHQINDNIKTVQELDKVMHDMNKEEQNLKKLDIAIAQGKIHLRNCQGNKIASLDGLIDKSQTISAWLKVLKFAKMKKKVASELCDREKTADSFLVIGESYMKQRKFKKALKWYMKGLQIFKALGNLEGQALTQINVGHVLDSQGDYEQALDAFTDSYRLALEAELPYVQLTALENMHFSNLNRFDDVEETRRLQLLIDKIEARKQ